MTITLGTKIVGSFGAMYPIWEGEVVADVEIDGYGTRGEVYVQWSDGSTISMAASDIIETVGKYPLLGFGIGYYTEDAYYNS